MRMTRWVFPLPATVVLTIAMFAVGCSDGKMGVTDGKNTAKEARQPVAKAYWKLHYSLGDQVFMTYGTGGFTDCADRNAKDSLVYIVSEPFEGKSAQQTDEQFVAMVKGHLSAVGWQLKPAGEKIQSAKKNGVEVQLRLLNRTKGDGALARLVVLGKCTNIGHAKDDVIKNYSGSERDEYKPSSASPSPMPTFLDPDTTS